MSHGMIGVPVKLIRLPDGEAERSRYQSEGGRFTIEGPCWKKNSGYGNAWTLTDSKRFMIDYRPRFGYAVTVQAVREAEAAGPVAEVSWYGYSTREAAQAAIGAHREAEREDRRFWSAIKRREERCKRAAAASPANGRDDHASP